jgi:hypothetical protein
MDVSWNDIAKAVALVLITLAVELWPLWATVVGLILLTKCAS